MRRRFIILVLSFTGFILGGCNLTSGQAVIVTMTPAHQAPNVRLGQIPTSPMPTQERPVRDIPTSLPATEPAVSSGIDVCDATGGDDLTQYQLVTNVDYLARHIDVSQRITYTNRAGYPLETLVLSVEPNAIAGAFTLHELLVGQEVPVYTLESNRLTVNLASALMPNCSLEMALRFEVKPPRITSGIGAFRGYFGYSPRQMNLAFWLPKVAPYRGEWLIHAPSTIGENAVFEQADWDVVVNLVNAPENLTVAASGHVEAVQPDQWRYRFEAARDFPMSVSESYNVSKATSRSGVTIEVYTFPDAMIQTDAGVLDAPAHVLNEALRSFEQYEALFGAYPYERLLVVQGDFPDGMEFSGLVFVSTAWFYSFTGGSSNYLTLITVHEVSHQWWYARVGNNAALAPWLDEALATYSEYIYYEEYYPELKNWWWSFRVAGYSPRGNVDSTVYEFNSIRDYINAVYLRGVQMLHNLRDAIGTEAFFALLNDYATQGDGDIGTPELFWSLLSEEQYRRTEAVRGDFFREPNILERSTLNDEGD